MKKSFYLIIIPLCGLLIYVSLSKKNSIEKAQERYSKTIKNHLFNTTLNLSKEERLAFGIPPNKYLEEKYLLEMNPYTGRTHPENIYNLREELKEKRAYQQRTPGDGVDNQWEERGPNNVGGRTRMVMYDPNDVTNKRVFAGGVSGGLWVNDDITDVASSWARVGVDENLAVTCMAVDPNNSQIMYLGTGELYVAQQALGNGIWKSTDGGVTWANIYKVRGTTTINTTSYVPGTYYITDIVVRDADGNSLTTNDSEVFASIGASFYSSNPINTFVGVNEYGIFKSTDEGSNWSQVTLDIDGNSVAPNDFELGIDNTLWLGTVRNIYGKGGGRIYSSSDGITFTLKHTIADGRRTEIAVSKSNANTVYVLGRVYTLNVAETALIAPFVSLLKTDDAFSTTPVALTLPDDVDTNISANDFTRGQAFYDLMIEVDPTDDAIAYVGGIDLFRTTDSGTTWSQISKWSNNNDLAALNVSSVHADQHTMVFHPSNSNTAIFGNDGGVYYTTSLSTASSNTTDINARNQDYNTVQFYNGAISQTEDPEYILGGAQDNGTHLVSSPTSGINSFTKVYGGDGGQCYINKDNSYMIVTTTYNRIRIFDLPYTGVNALIVSDGTTGSFINAMALDENLDILYTNGSNHLARFSDITTSSPAPRTNITDALLSDITAIKVSPFTIISSKVFVGTRTGKIVKIENADTATQTITDISSPSFLGSVSSVEFGASENEIMVTFYNFGVESIWFTEDGGISWSNKEGDFPDITVRCILMNPLNNHQVIIGTELGVWNSNNFKDDSPVWNQSYNGMSDVTVTSFSLRTSDNTILASSFGRGMYTGTFKGNDATTWTGSLDSDWSKAGNWSDGLPTNILDVVIPNTLNKPVINSDISVGNLSVESSSSLTINAEGSLTIRENLTNSGTLTINSTAVNSGSLIVEGTSTGNVDYARFLSASSWHLISSPVSGKDITDFYGSVAQSDPKRGIAPYVNTNAATAKWAYYTTADTPGDFVQGKGYTIKKNTPDGTLIFSGTLNTNDAGVNIEVLATGDKYNTIGNPFTSYINSGAFLGNVAAGRLTEKSIWLWDEEQNNGVGDYITSNIAAAYKIAPGQAFFVQTQATGDVNFSEDLQTHLGGDTFLKAESRPEIKFSITDGINVKSTEIFYIKDKTTGFDDGYDSSIFSGGSNSFTVYTQLVTDHDGEKLSIQSLPNSNYENMVIPVGLNAEVGKEITFSLNASNFPSGMKIFLEDRVANTFIRLDEINIEYTITLLETSIGVGRFFIHTRYKTLSSTDYSFTDVHLYCSNKSIHIKNLPSESGLITIFDTQGKEVFRQKLNRNQDKISVKELSNAFYIIQIETDQGSFKRKISIQ